jgi:hypothetical protein
VGLRAGPDGCGNTHPHRDSIPGPSSPQRVAIPTELSWPSVNNTAGNHLVLVDSLCFPAVVCLSQRDVFVTATSMDGVVLCVLTVRPAESCLIHCSLPRLIVLNPTLVPTVHLQRRSTSDGVRELLSAKGWARHGRSNLAQQRDSHVIVGFFNMPQSCDMGQTALLPLRRKACCGFFRSKNPTASGGFEPANLGTSGQHAIH